MTSPRRPSDTSNRKRTLLVYAERRMTDAKATRLSRTVFGTCGSLIADRRPVRSVNGPFPFKFNKMRSSISQSYSTEY
jgi:hypothetical protein